MGAHSAKTAPAEKSMLNPEAARVYDPTFRGPIKNRGCTDIICLIIFLIFILAFLVIGLYAFAMGDPRYLIYPVDSSGNICGYGQHANEPYLFYFDFVKCFIKDGQGIDIQNILSFGCDTPQICVNSCPNRYWAPLPPPLQNFQYAYCRDGINTSTITTIEQMSSLIQAGNCAPYYLNETPVVYRCIPTLIGAIVDSSGHILVSNTSTTTITTASGSSESITNNTVVNAIQQLTSLIDLQGYGTKILGDVVATWWLILIFVTIAMVLSFIWIFIMRWIAGIMVWITLGLFAGFFSFAIYYCFNKYVTLKAQHGPDQFILTTDFQYYINLYQTWLALGIIAAIMLGLIILILIFLVKRICIAIELIKESSRAVSCMLSVLFWPLVPYVLQLIVLAYWGATAICLAAATKGNFCNVTYTGNSSSVPTDPYSSAHCNVAQGFFNHIPCNASAPGIGGSVCNFIRNGGDTYTYVLQAFQLFMWLWIMNFIIALGQITLAGAFASYYWAFNKPNDIPTFPLASSLGRALRYHIGSMAFGALIIAIIQFVRIILEYMDRKLKASQNCFAHFLLRCCICCLWCLEKFMKFINKNAYIMIAIYGKNFCASAANAFSLIVRNCIRVIVVDGVADFLLFVSKLFVVGAVGVLSYFFFAREIPGISNVIGTLQLNYYLVPIIIIIAGTYVITSGFFAVYSMAVDTIFLCFLEDLERHDGTPEKPYYMSKELMRILGKKNIAPGTKKPTACCC